MLMKNSYLISSNANSFNFLNRSFTVLYHGLDGVTLHGYVTQLSSTDFQVYIKEKDVIIQCKRDEFGILSCNLNSKKNVPWVDGINNAVARMLLEQ